MGSETPNISAVLEIQKLPDYNNAPYLDDCEMEFTPRGGGATCHRKASSFDYAIKSKRSITEEFANSGRKEHDSRLTRSCGRHLSFLITFVCKKMGCCGLRFNQIHQRIVNIESDVSNQEQTVVSAYAENWRFRTFERTSNY